MRKKHKETELWQYVWKLGSCVTSWILRSANVPVHTYNEELSHTHSMHLAMNCLLCMVLKSGHVLKWVRNTLEGLKRDGEGWRRWLDRSCEKKKKCKRRVKEAGTCYIKDIKEGKLTGLLNKPHLFCLTHLGFILMQLVALTCVTCVRTCKSNQLN